MGECYDDMYADDFDWETDDLPPENFIDNSIILINKDRVGRGGKRSRRRFKYLGSKFASMKRSRDPRIKTLRFK